MLLPLFGAQHPFIEKFANALVSKIDVCDFITNFDSFSEIIFRGIAEGQAEEDFFTRGIFGLRERF